MKMEKEVDRGGRELRNTTHRRCHRKLEAGRTDPLPEPRPHLAVGLLSSRTVGQGMSGSFKSPSL